MNHTFSPIQGPSDDPSMQYQQCQRCKKIMFMQGDDYFNLICQPKVQDRETLRKELENGRS